MQLPPNVKIQLPIDRDTKFGMFRDAIYFTEAELEAMTEADLEAAIVARVDKFVADTEAASNTEAVPEEPINP